MDAIKMFTDLPLKCHIFFGFMARMALIVYSNYHDQNYDVPYTDVDYKVFTDAARHVWYGRSPFERHTFRYSPLIAYLLIPNITLHKEFGKVLFSIFDVLITIAVKKLVQHELGSKNEKTNLISTYSALFWLYNPVSVAISTRGNADSLPCFFLILSLMFLQTDLVKSWAKYVISGALLAVAIHLRLYPAILSFSMYLSLGTYQFSNVDVQYFVRLAFPNFKQIVFTASCLITFILLTLNMYYNFGYDFLFETYIYHIFRKDTRHNFSVFFYYSYLTLDLSHVLKTVCRNLQGIVVFAMSLIYGTDPKTLTFGLFCETVVLVAYNSVMTSQYFIWFLSLLPLVVHNFKMAKANAVVYALIWVAAQAAWLFYAYLLEFKCRQVFIFIWLKSVIFFCANVFILGQIMKCYTPGYGFGLIDNSVNNEDMLAHNKKNQ